MSGEMNGNPGVKSTVNRIGWCLCIMIGMMQLTPPFWRMLFDILSSSGTEVAVFFAETLVQTLFYLSCFMVPAVLFYPMSKRKRPETIRCDLKMPALSPLLILGGLSVVLVVAVANGFLMDLIGMPSSSDPGYVSNNDAVYMYITMALAPAFCEEFLFRGVIYGNLRRYGKGSALIISSLLFAFMHQNVGQTLYTFAAGVVMALCYELTGTIWCSTFLHLFNNLSAAIQQILLSRMGEAAYPILTLVDVGIVFLGLISILLLCILGARRKQKGEALFENAWESNHGTESALIFGRVPAELSQDMAENENHQDTSTTLRPYLAAPGMIIFLVLTAIFTIVHMCDDFGWLLI